MLFGTINGSTSGGGGNGFGYYMQTNNSTQETYLVENGNEVHVFPSASSPSDPSIYSDDNIEITYKGRSAVDITFKKACSDYRYGVAPVTRTAGTSLSSQDVYGTGPWCFAFE